MTEKTDERKTDVGTDADLAFLRSGGEIRVRFTLARDSESPTGFSETSEKIYEIPVEEDGEGDGLDREAATRAAQKDEAG